MHRHRLRGLFLGFGDETEVAHALQHVIAADARSRRIGDRIAAGRELRDRSQGGDLVQVELVELLAEIELGGGGDAVGAVAEECLVERSEEHTSELQSLMRISYAVFCLKKKNKHNIKSSTLTT